MMKKNDARFQIASDPDHEHVVCEIYFQGLYVGCISQERGRGEFDYESPGPELKEDMVGRKLCVVDLKILIDEAVQHLKGSASGNA